MAVTLDPHRGLVEQQARADAALEQDGIAPRAVFGQRRIQCEPVGRGIALWVARRLVARTDAELSERVIRLAARLEEAIPTSRWIDRFIREQAPDVVLATPVVARASTQVDYLKSARRLRVPAATCVASWDNLTNKGIINVQPDRVIVWNEAQKREAVSLHGVRPDDVRVTGAQLFDDWFERSPATTREQFCARVGLDPSRPFLLYLCSSLFIARDEVSFVRTWLDSWSSGSRPCGEAATRGSAA